MSNSKKINNRFPGFPLFSKKSGNFWCYPIILDNYWNALSGSEQKTLDYILRRTWGWKKESDQISLSQLEKGIKNFDKGIGLSRPTIVKSLKELQSKGFIKKSKGRKANYYELVINFNYPSKESLPFASKENLHTIDNNTINNKQYVFSSKKEKINAYKDKKRWNERPHYNGEEMRWIEGKQKWKVIPKDGSEWLEFCDTEEEIEWKKV